MPTVTRPLTTVLAAALLVVLAALVLAGHLPAHALTLDACHGVDHLPVPVRNALLTPGGSHWLAHHTS